ncbi:hypothetical protein SAMN04487955_111165 [Halomonas korlensis]|uniref:Uncharacterized protein n=1 Tax=Halomonas korlensis TaxID=463301 RepID=A0A1I7JQB3_9GAMM|nr:hypothetical protein SAMN04487955_111165 [Halomonas korlensis]
MVALGARVKLAASLSRTYPGHIGLAHRKACGHFTKRTAGRHDPVAQILTIGLPPSPSHGIILPRALHQDSLRYSGSLFQALPPKETLHKSHRSCLIAIGGVEFDPPTTV